MGPRDLSGPFPVGAEVFGRQNILLRLVQVIGPGASLDSRLCVNRMLEKRWGERCSLRRGWRSALAPGRKTPSTGVGGAYVHPVSMERY